MHRASYLAPQPSESPRRDSRLGCPAQAKPSAAKAARAGASSGKPSSAGAENPFPPTGGLYFLTVPHSLSLSSHGTWSENDRGALDYGECVIAI